MTHIEQLGGGGIPVTGPAPDASPERVRALAAQFESLLLTQMLKEMRASMFDEKEESGLGSGPLADALFSELSLALSRTGGVGLGDAVVGPLMRQAGPGTDPATAPVGLTSLPGTGTAAYASPGVTGRVTSGYGWREDPINGARKFQHGVDIALPEGYDVPVARSGRVTFAGEQSGYGLTVVVDHGDGIATRYAHLSRVDVRVGDDVSGGRVIAQSGSSGRATGAHLHVEVIDGGKRVNPAEILGSYVNDGPTGR